jgi:adenine-specific DNA-methyltransferase
VMDAALTTRKQKAIFDAKVDSTEFLERIDFFRTDATRRLDPKHRSEKGQFFTPPLVARLMASMFAERPQNLKILDAGAGVGSLSAALIVDVCSWERKPASIIHVAYEIEPLLVDYLHSTFNGITKLCEHEGITFVEEIFQEDFIAAGVAMINGGLFPENRKRFNCVIMNPPYHKISNNSETRRLLRLVDIETTNFYTAFLWLAIKLLESGGELVAITPRSFCNGPYFRPFREAFFKSMSLRRVHVFESRNMPRL